MPTRTNIADRLRVARQDASLSRGDVAARIGISERTVGNYENGTHKLPLEVAVAFAEALGVSVEWIAYGDAAEGGPAPRLAAAGGERRFGGERRSMADRRAGSWSWVTPPVIGLLILALFALQLIDLVVHVVSAV